MGHLLPARTEADRGERNRPAPCSVPGQELGAGPPPGESSFGLHARRAESQVALSCAALPHAEYEIEASRQAAAGLGDFHQELAAEQAVAAVLRLAGKVELRRQHAAAGRLHLHVIVARAAFIGAGHHREEAVAPLGVGELMAAQAETGIVVVAGVVGMPEIDQRACDRPAAAREHEADKLDRLSLDAGLAQVETLGRARLEERAFGLAEGRLVAAGRRRWALGLRS